MLVKKKARKQKIPQSLRNTTHCIHYILFACLFVLIGVMGWTQALSTALSMLYIHTPTELQSPPAIKINTDQINFEKNLKSLHSHEFLKYQHFSISVALNHSKCCDFLRQLLCRDDPNHRFILLMFYNCSFGTVMNWNIISWEQDICYAILRWVMTHRLTTALISFNSGQNFF